MINKFCKAYETDSGIVFGMPTENLKKILEAFVKFQEKEYTECKLTREGFRCEHYNLGDCKSRDGCIYKSDILVCPDCGIPIEAERHSECCMRNGFPKTNNKFIPWSEYLK